MKKWLIMALFSGLTVGVFAAPRPNILLILSDDAGYADFGMHGSTEIKTPNIDALAAGGVRFSQGYVSSSVCAPSRMGLLTGRNQSRFGCGNNLPTSSALGLPASETTMADMLKRNGYTTYALGKWHLGHTPGHRPTERGFDHFYGFLGGMRTYNKGGEKMSGLQRMYENEEVIPEEEWYLTDKLGDRAIEYLEMHCNSRKDNPFFMYLSFNAVHTPMEAAAADLAGIDAAAFKNDKRRILAAMTVAMDRNVGRVLDTVKRLGLEKHTLVVFLNDNGGPNYSNASNNEPLRGAKGSFYEGGLRVPFAVRWPGVIPAGRVIDVPVISFDLFATFGQAAGADLRSLELDGVNLFPLMLGKESRLPRDEFFWRIKGSGGEAVLRKGDWKYYRSTRYKFEHLYNLATDPSEANDLSSTYPEKMEEMKKRVSVWEKQMQEPVYWWNRKDFETYRVEGSPEPQ